MVPWFLMALYPIAGDWRKASAGDAAYGYNMQVVLLPRSPKWGGNGVFSAQFSPLPTTHAHKTLTFARSVCTTTEKAAGIPLHASSGGDGE